VIGHLDYFETGLGYGNGGLFGVGVVRGVEAGLIDGLVMCSAEIRANAMARTVGRGQYRTSVGEMHATRSELVAVALVDETASVTSTKVRAWSGDYRVELDRGRWAPLAPEILARAAKAARWDLRWSRPQRLQVHRPDDRG
jgi:hypothetical protein